jgi:hypothetical protein
MERYLPVNLLGPGPSSLKKLIYRAAVSQRLGNTELSSNWHSRADTLSLPLSPACVFVIRKFVREQGCSWTEVPLYFRSSPVSIIPHMFHISLHLHVALTRKTNGRIAGNFEQNWFSEIREHSTGQYVHLFLNSPLIAEVGRYSNQGTVCSTEEQMLCSRLL